MDQITQMPDRPSDLPPTPDYTVDYTTDVDEVIDWEALGEMDSGDIKAMIPLIMERLIALL